MTALLPLTLMMWGDWKSAPRACGRTLNTNLTEAFARGFAFGCQFLHSQKVNNTKAASKEENCQRTTLLIPVKEIYTH